MKMFITIILCCTSSLVIAQNDSLVESKILALQELFSKNNYEPLSFDDTSLFVIRTISEFEDLTQFPDRSVYLEKRAEQLRKDLGIGVVGSYIENFDLDPIEDLEENISYQRRVQVGMQWDLLSSGYLENQLQAQILEDRILREKLGNDLDKESQYYLKRFDQTVYAFNQFKLDLLTKRERELTQQYELIRDLVILKKLKKEQLIRIEIRLGEVKSLINVYKSYNDFLTVDRELLPFNSTKLPLIDLDYETIFQLLGLQTDSLATGITNIDYYKWYHQVGLRPFMRYNYYDIIATDDRSYFSAGINLTVPLTFNTDLRNEVENERLRYETERFSADRAKLLEDVMDMSYAFRYQMKQFMDKYQRRKLVAERLRIEKAKFRLQKLSVEPTEGLKYYDDLLEADIALIDLLQGLYLKALRIHTKLPGTSIDQVVKPTEAMKLYEFTETPARAVYIWSKTFENYDSDFLAEYAIYNEFEKVIVAADKDDRDSKKNNFLTYAAENAEVYLMLGNNQLFYHDSIAQYLFHLIDTYKGVKVKGIHLDIEPHTFENWESERELLLNQYIELVRDASAFCKKRKLKLEVSVPKHYDKQIMDEVFVLCDKVYFMCYENVETEFLVRKLKDYVELYNEKVVIALRTEDFSSRLEMEDKIVALQEALGVKAFAYHDLQRVILLDKEK